MTRNTKTRKIHYDGHLWEHDGTYKNKYGVEYTYLTRTWVTNDRFRDLHVEVREVRTGKLMNIHANYEYYAGY